MYIKKMKFNVDMHVHSRASGDSDADPEELILRAIKIGLHGIAFTEHYSYGASEPVERLREKYRNNILVFRGVELSAAEGHCLAFGVNTDDLLSKHLPAAEVLRVVSEHGGVVIPSHPFRGINSLGDAIRSMKGICAIEGRNGNNLNSLNLKAVEAAAELQLPYTGGSDAHDIPEVGFCYTEFAEKVTCENFIDLLKAGNYRGIDARKTSTVAFPFAAGKIGKI